MEIAIIGAGMEGLTTGITLKKFGNNVTIYEQAEQILPVGAAISLWSNGLFGLCRWSDWRCDDVI